MLMTPALLALQVIALCVTGMVLLAGGFAGQILRHWDLNSGSERQIRLERQTYLVSTLLGFALGAELLSLVLFVQTAENLSSQFVGAMCATGVLNVNRFGFPTLLLKIALFFLAALWLLLNRVDQQGYDYPLVRLKYGLLLAMAPLSLAEAAVQTAFLRGLNPDVITSCCGALFSPQATGAGADLAGWPPGAALAWLYATGGLTLIVGLILWRWQRAGWLFAAASFASFAVALAAIISSISLYVYESPHHHCPFCLLQAGHGYVGYLLYAPLFLATAAGLGAGILASLRRVPSLQTVLPGEIRRWAGLALAGFIGFYGLASWLIWRSHLILLG